MDMVKGGFFRELWEIKREFIKRLAAFVRERGCCSGVRRAARRAWAGALGFFASAAACVKNPGISELIALAALAAAAVGGAVSLFNKRARRAAPIFGALAAFGAALLILRLIFPRRER